MARRDSLVGVRDELDTPRQRYDALIPSNRHHPVREMALAISAGFSRMEMAGDEGIETRRGGGCLRGERGVFDSGAVSLQHLAATQCITDAGCPERAGIGTRRADGVPIVIERAMLTRLPCY
jgi:hypothetical protein